MKPPENVLFVAQLNQITQDADLELLFSRFGHIRKCEVIRDFKTGDSLQYAFIEFEAERDAEEAVFKMNGVLVDDRRIYVDFSQSVSKSWQAFKTQGARMHADQAAVLANEMSGLGGGGKDGGKKGGKKGGKGKGGFGGNGKKGGGKDSWDRGGGKGYGGGGDYRERDRAPRQRYGDYYRD